MMPVESVSIIYEDVGEYLVGRDFIINPKNDLDTFHIYVQSINDIYEMIETDSTGIIGDWDTWDQFSMTLPSSFFYWKPTAKKNHYIVPGLENIGQETIEKLNFKDTTYWYHGEMSGTYFGNAWLYEGHIVDYMVYTSFIRIERHNHGLQGIEWLRFEYSYGC